MNSTNQTITGGRTSASRVPADASPAETQRPEGSLSGEHRRAQRLSSTRPLNAVAPGEAPGGTAEAAVLPENPSGVMASLRALPRAAWILFLGVFLNRFGTFVIPFLSLYMKRKGFS